MKDALTIGKRIKDIEETIADKQKNIEHNILRSQFGSLQDAIDIQVLKTNRATLLWVLDLEYY